MRLSLLAVAMLCAVAACKPSEARQDSTPPPDTVTTVPPVIVEPPRDTLPPVSPGDSADCQRKRDAGERCTLVPTPIVRPPSS